MPDNLDSAPTGAPAALDNSDRPGDSAPDEPDQPGDVAPPHAYVESWRDSSGMCARRLPHTTVVRVFGYVRPRGWLVAAGSLMGGLKLGLPLAFPLALKYVFDVLLVPQPHLEWVNRLVDRWCIALATLLRLGEGPAAKLEALTAGLFVLFIVQAIATYYRNYWASMAGHRLIFDLRYALFRHMQRLSHSFFDRNASGGIVSRFVSDIQLAQNFVGSAMINIWMDGISLGLVVWICSCSIGGWRVSLVVVLLYVAVIRALSPRIKRASHQLQEVVEEFSESCRNGWPAPRR